MTVHQTLRFVGLHTTDTPSPQSFGGTASVFRCDCHFENFSVFILFYTCTESLNLLAGLLLFLGVVAKNLSKHVRATLSTGY